MQLLISGKSDFCRKGRICLLFSAQSLRIMKLTVLLLTLACLQVTADANAQRINLILKNVDLKKVFTELKKQTSYYFVYSDDDLKKCNKINIEVNNASMEEVLEVVFKNQPLQYSIEENRYIIVKPKITASSNTDTTILKEVKGKITNEMGEPVESATVKVKGGNNITFTDSNGEFKLTNVGEDKLLDISSIGYENQEIPAKSKNPIVIVLKKEYKSLDETIVVAYGTTTKRLNTGNIGKVTSDEIGKQPVSNPLATLVGRVPGLIVTQGNGLPGSSFNVQIRGRNSIAQGSNPLFVIDGVPFAPGNDIVGQLGSALTTSSSVTGVPTTGLSPFSLINPSDIESIEILKDADATSIYGSRGANGVVLITTKKGRQGKTRASINIQTGVSKITRTMKLLNTSQYLEMRREAFSNDGLEPNPINAFDLLLFDTTRFTDYSKDLIGGNAETTNIQVSVTGGNTFNQFLIGAGFHSETSVFPGDLADRKGSMHVNFNHESRDKKFRVTISSIYGNDNNKLIVSDLTNFIFTPPNAPSFLDSAGNLVWNYKGANIENPLSYLFKSYTAKSDNILSSLNVQYEAFSGLILRSSFGANVFWLKETTKNPLHSQNPNDFPTSYASFGNNDYRNWIIEPQIEYKKSWKKSLITLLVGATFQDSRNSSFQITGFNYSNDDLLGSIRGAGIVNNPSNTADEYKYNAFFGRVNYNYSDKYIINLSARRDGSSRFGPDKRFSNFGSVGAAWIFSNEKFLSNTVLSFGKLRASLGTSGNDNIGNYQYLHSWGSSASNYQGNPVLSPTSLFNPDYSWETNTKFETGVELGFIEDRILFNVSYFRNRSSNQLVQYDLPSQTGFISILNNFPALVQNTGIEIELASKNMKGKDFQWMTSLNISFPRNKLISFPNLSTSSYGYKLTEGEPLSAYGGYIFLGVNSQTGIYEFADKNGLATSTPSYPGDYRVNLGNTDPSYVGGIRNTLNYKEFELDIFFDFKKQNGVTYLWQLAYKVPGRISNLPVDVMERWQKPGDVTTIQKFTQSNSSPANQAATIFRNNNSTAKYGDASYIRWRNLSFSYRLPLNLVRPLAVESCRLFFSGQNLLTITNYNGGDPESQNFTSLPPLKTFSFGLNVNF